jgi:hypothetical protein
MKSPAESWLRIGAAVLVRSPHAHDPVRVTEREIAEEESVHDAEDRRIGTDA